MINEPIENVIQNLGDGFFWETKNAMQQCVFLPEPEPGYTLLTLICCGSSLRSNTLPRVFCYGLKGSGKSELGKFAAAMRGVPLLPAKCTYAAIRNVLNSMSTYEDSDEGKEGSLLVWDNLSVESLLANNDLYQLLLAGYSKSSSKIQISSGVAGTNLTFDTFSPVIFSSVFPLHIQVELEELHRRLIVVPFKPWEMFSPEGLKHYQEIGVESIFDKQCPDFLDFSYLSQSYQSYWNDDSNTTLLMESQVAIRKELRNKKSRLRSLSSQFVTLLVDVLANGLALGAFAELDEAVEFAIKLSKSQQTIQEQSESAVESLLAAHIQESTEVQRLTNQALIAQGLKPAKLRISAEDIKQYLDNLQQQGRLERKVGVSERTAIMGKLGFRLDKKSWLEI